MADRQMIYFLFIQSKVFRPRVLLGRGPGVLMGFIGSGMIKTPGFYWGFIILGVLLQKSKLTKINHAHASIAGKYLILLKIQPSGIQIFVMLFTFFRE